MQDSAPHTWLPSHARQQIRQGYTGTTSGWCNGWAQANLLAVPREQAFDLMLFSQRNPKACPLLDVFDPGATTSPRFHGDITRDLPAYRVYEHGELTEERSEVTELWRDDLVTFLFGCYFSFERALVEAGIEMRHNRKGTTVPMYRTSMECEPAGAFTSTLVVSMRGVPTQRLSDATRISARYPAVHGAPVHFGDPSAIGIADVHRPDWGDPPLMDDGDIPVFWACGVTPQEMVMQSRLEFAIAHAPGRMVITDIPEADLITP